MTSSSYNFDATSRDTVRQIYKYTKTIWSNVGGDYNFKNISNQNVEVFKDLKP